MGYNAATIARMNAEQALRDAFPDHRCEDSREVEEYIDEMYVRKDDADVVREERDRLAETIRQIVADQEDRVGLTFDRWWARDLIAIVNDNT